MADLANDTDAKTKKEGKDGLEEPEAPKSRKILILAGVLVLSALGGATFYLVQNPGLVGLGPGEQEVEEAEALTPSKFIDIPEIIADLRGPRGSGSFIRLKMILEVETTSDISWIKSIRPRIIDAVQVYLRRQNRAVFLADDGTQRTREALHAVIQEKAKPVKIRNVLFKEFIVR